MYYVKSMLTNVNLLSVDTLCLSILDCVMSNSQLRIVYLSSKHSSCGYYGNNLPNNSNIRIKYLTVILLMCTYLAITTYYCYADDAIYQYTDKNGNLVISNNPPGTQGNKRSQILKEELSKEQSALKEAQDLLAQNGKYDKQKIPDNRLNDAIKEHEKNIEILKKQLGYSKSK
ncbi:MAG: hypothetical protein QG673_1728 [Pseudomonadota bacterium]|nr:hypothetical protein [Pseudomonadota bacterium]